MVLAFEIYGLKSSQLGIAEVKIDGKSVGELDFYTAGATEKVALSVASQDCQMVLM